MTWSRAPAPSCNGPFVVEFTNIQQQAATAHLTLYPRGKRTTFNTRNGYKLTSTVSTSTGFPRMRHNRQQHPGARHLGDSVPGTPIVVLSWLCVITLTYCIPSGPRPTHVVTRVFFCSFLPFYSYFSVLPLSVAPVTPLDVQLKLLSFLSMAFLSARYFFWLLPPSAPQLEFFPYSAYA